MITISTTKKVVSWTAQEQCLVGIALEVMS